MPRETRHIRCAQSMQLPCYVKDINYTSIGHAYCGRGSYGCVVQALNMQNYKVYAIKFSQSEIHPQSMHFLDEINTTLTIQNYLKSLPEFQQKEESKIPTIRLYDYDKEIFKDEQNRTIKNVVFVMEHHHLGDADKILRSPMYLLSLRKHRDEFVLKLLHDIGTVLHAMYQNKMIDRDCKLKNILISGNPKHPLNTTFVKCDYGSAISVDVAIKELRQTNTHQNGFCHFGTNVSPIDVRIMYGHYRSKGNESIQQRNDAAKLLIKNLESNDLIDLVQAAIQFYDRLTVNASEKIGLYQDLKGHDEGSRRKVINEKILTLTCQYGNERYQDPQIMPLTVKEMLVKFEWLSVKQLPGLDCVNTRKYLTWRTFCKWMLNVARHQQYWIYHYWQNIAY